MPAPLKALYLGEVECTRVRSWSEAAEWLNKEYKTSWDEVSLRACGTEGHTALYLPAGVVIGKVSA